MTKAEILAELQQWQREQQTIDFEIADLRRMSDSNTEQAAKLVGDTTGALNWWKHQCKYGENPLSAGKGNKMRLISNLKQLAALIAE